MKVVGISIAALTGVLFLSPTGWAQSSSSTIAGSVKDGAGMPVANAKVEVSSPALIERVRAVTTDGQGLYRVIDLPIGVYDVTFSAPGFSTVNNVGINLPAAFTATVNGSLKAGSPGETITVTGAASQVDTQSATQVTNTTSDTFENAPTGSKQVTAVGSTVAGLTGGSDSSGEGGVSSNIGGSFHGKTGGGNKTQFDGYRIQNQQALGNTLYIVNTDAVSSVALETGGTTAESIASGFAANMVPKSGSNTFGGQLGGMYANDKFQGNNVTQALKDRGLGQTSVLKKQYDIGGTFSGPIKKDKLWFFEASRSWGASSQQAGPLYYNMTQGSPDFRYTPDFSKPWIRDNSVLTNAVRLSWNASPRNKLRFFADWQDAPTPGSANQFAAPEAATSAWKFYPQALFQGTWSSPVTKKLLIEAGFGTSINHWTRCLPSSTGDQCGPVPTAISVLDLTNNFQYNSYAANAVGSSPGLGKVHTGDRYSQRLIVSYTTGSHAIRAGVQQEEGIKDSDQIINDSVQYVVRAPAGQNPSTTGLFNVVPVQINEFAMPFFVKMRIKADLGIFLQDQWTFKRASLNYGLRFDYFNAFDPGQRVEAGRFVGVRDFPALYRVPAFSDLSPRAGLAYDLTGKGKTALKVAVGRYVGPADLSTAENNNFMVSSVNQTSRAWINTKGDFIPACDLTNPGRQDNRAIGGDFCGEIQNPNFGKLNPFATIYGDDAIHGFGHRDYNWDVSMEVQHEVSRAVSVSAGYYYSAYGNFFLSNQTSVTSADFNNFCIKTPVSAALPGGGGQLRCAFFDVKQESFANLNKTTEVHQANAGQRRNDFFNVSLTSRFKSGLRVTGGVDWGRIVKDDCFAADHPEWTTQLDLNSPRTRDNQRTYCHEVSPWMSNLQVKLQGSYPLPYDTNVSAIFQNVAGPPILANYTAPLSALYTTPAADVHYVLSGSVNNLTVPLIEPGTQYEDRRTQVDFRVTKNFKAGPKAKIQVNLDAYNLLNLSPVLSRNNTFGSSWNRVQSIQTARLMQLSGRVSF